MEFRLLGPFDIRAKGATIPVPVGKQRAVLVALLLRANQVVPLDELAMMVWGSNAPPSARITLQNYVKRIRRLLGDQDRELIATTSAGYLLSAGVGELDVLTFDMLRRTAAQAALEGDWRQAADHLHAALALWRGEPLIDVPDCPLVRDERPRLADSRLLAAEASAEADLHLGHYEGAITQLQQLTAAEPLREHVQATLMLALYRAGRQADALAVYQGARRTLIAELGVEPGPELRAMQQDILAANPALGSRGVPPAAPPGPLAPRQLPPDLADFCGRHEEVRTLRDLMLPPDGFRRPGVVAIAAVVGTGGIGKTALAVHSAHQLSPWFPDGQLYISLRAASAAPLASGEVLARFLRHLNAGSDMTIPDTEEERSALYRSLLADKRVLVVLDDAHDPAQVRPLLPGGAGCGVLITSRNWLAGLEGCRDLNLDVMSDGETRALLTSIVGPERVDADPHATEELMDACAGLPLAVRIMGARLSMRPGWTLRTMVNRLQDATSSLDEMAMGTVAVRASFQVSYTALLASQPGTGADPARVFRLLGLATAADISTDAASVLLGGSLATVRAAMEDLAETHLLEATAPGRYRLHDLLRVYAAEVAEKEEPEAERKLAVRRLLNWYLYSALSAAKVLNPSRRHVPLDSSFTASWPPPQFDGYDDALGWLDAEQANLVAAVSQASHWDEHEIAWKLAVTLWDLFNLRNNWSDWISTHEIGLKSARLLEDRTAEVWLLVNLAAARIRTGDNEAAAGLLTRALELNRQLSYPPGEAVCSVNLGVAYENMGQLEAATKAYERALFLYREISNKRGEGVALNGLGAVFSLYGDHGRAAAFYEKSRVAFREVRDRYGEAAVQLDYSRALLRSGAAKLAIENSRKAVSLNREVGHRHAEAMSLATLGQALSAAGQEDTGEALQCRAEAQEIFRLIGGKDAIEKV